MSTAFRIEMDNVQEVPDTISTATGLGTVVFDSTAVTATYNITVAGLDFGEVLGIADQTPDPGDDVHGVHVHNAARGVNGSVVFGQREPAQDNDDVAFVLNANGSTTISGIWETTDPASSSLNNFAAALGAATLGSDVPLYWNIHTEEFPGGEIRGQWVCIATDNGETVEGTDGDDILPGLGGDDTVNGGLGNDTLEGGADNDTLNGGSGRDTASYAGAAAGVTVALATTTAQNTVGAGTDTLSSMEDLIGSGFADTLSGTSGDNTISGGGNNDNLKGFAGNDVLNGEAGNDTLNGGATHDTLNGGDDDDTLIGQDGNDALNGGNGIDTASYVGAVAGVTVALGTTTAQNTGGDGTDTLSSMENLIGSNHADTLSGTAGDNTISGGGNGDDVTGFAGNDILNGDNGNDTLNGGANDDTLNGGANDDTLIGQDGNDTLAGGNGVDTASYVGAVAGVTVSLATTTAQNTVGDGTDTLSSIENVVGSGFTDTLNGSAGDNTVSGGGSADNVKGFAGNDVLNGEAGDDTLNGGANNDTLNGGENNDTLIGQDGNDTLAGGNGVDTASYVGAVAGVTISLATTTAQNTVGDGTDTLSSIENVIGSNFADTLNGSAGDNVISGGGQNDVLKGFSGVDALSGGNGNDTLDGGNSNDTLSGGEGDDDLIGQDLDDTLTGNAGADEFIVRNNHGADTVTDFQDGSDTVRLIGVTGVDDFGDLVLTDTGPGVLVDYGTGTILLATVSDINTIDASDFSFA